MSASPCPPVVRVVADVAAALCMGVTLLAGAYSVGRYHEATIDELRFACLDLRGGVVEAVEVERHVVDLWAPMEETERHDWSAFGAAKAFVDQVGLEAAAAALRGRGVGEAAHEVPAVLRCDTDDAAFAPPLKLRFAWTTQETDRDGRPTLRTCVLDRMRWPGLAVWHERGRYQVMSIERHGLDERTCFPTGFSFATQRALVAHLESLLPRREG